MGASMADKARQDGDNCVEEDTEPQSSLAGLPSIARKHTVVAFSRMKLTIKDDIKHRNGKFCIVASSSVVTGGAGKTIKNAGSSVWDSFSRILDVERNILGGLCILQ